MVVSNKLNVINWSRWCNGLARLKQCLSYLQGPGFESHLLPVELFSVIRFVDSIETLLLRSVPSALIS